MGLADEINGYIPAVIGLEMSRVLINKTKTLGVRPRRRIVIRRVRRVRRRKK